jgi:hypothetical protein
LDISFKSLTDDILLIVVPDRLEVEHDVGSFLSDTLEPLLLKFLKSKLPFCKESFFTESFLAVADVLI